MKLSFQTPNVWIDQAYDIFNSRSVELKSKQLSKFPQIIIAGMQSISGVLQIEALYTQKTIQNVFLDIPRINKGIKMIGILLEENSNQFKLLFIRAYLPDFNQLINSILEILVNDGNTREICLAEQILFFRGILSTFYTALQSMLQNISNLASHEMIWQRCLKQLEQKFMHNLAIIEFQKSDISTGAIQVGSWNKISQELIQGVQYNEHFKISYFQINARCVLISKKLELCGEQVSMIKFTSLISFPQFKNLIAKKFNVHVQDVQAIMYEMKEKQMRIIENEDSFEVIVLQLEKYKAQENLNSIFIDIQVELSDDARYQAIDDRQEVKMAKNYDNVINEDQVTKIQCDYCGKLQILPPLSNLKDWACPFCYYQREKSK